MLRFNFQYLSACLTLVSLSAGSAFAGNDGKTYPAIMCHPMEAVTNLETERTALYGYMGPGRWLSNLGMIEWSFEADGTVRGNFREETQRWVCPVVRDHLGSVGIQDRLDSYRIRRASVNVVDDHSQRDLCCDVISMSADGNLLDSLRKCTTGFSPLPQRLDFPDVNIAEASDGVYQIECYVPPPELWAGTKYYSKIISYETEY